MLPLTRSESLDSSLAPPDYSLFAITTPPPDYLTLEDQTTCHLGLQQQKQYKLVTTPPRSVTSRSCHDLISFLYSVDQMLKSIPQGLQRVYMCRAELRYIRWLQVLQREKPSHIVISNMIIPPLDVMLCWYAHMLSPYRYRDDLIRNSWEHVFNYPLPLFKTREVKTRSGTGRDPLSERFWLTFLPDEPYDLDLNELNNDERTFTCVFCQESQPSTWGLMLDSDGQRAKSNTEKGIKVQLMARFMKFHDNDPVFTSSMLTSSTTCNWNNTLRLLKSVRQLEDMTWCILLDMVKSSYVGIVTPLCIDLVQADVPDTHQGSVPTLGLVIPNPI
ncbi:hypothetical protein BC941DRAFT_452475 [Chlamydoabsidia padenii]|nr:hypothetical protein BC941DRAFT_452475 [Chlamydoabsidia padenii]